MVGATQPVARLLRRKGWVIRSKSYFPNLKGSYAVRGQSRTPPPRRSLVSLITRSVHCTVSCNRNDQPQEVFTKVFPKFRPLSSTFNNPAQVGRLLSTTEHTWHHHKTISGEIAPPPPAPPTTTPGCWRLGHIRVFRAQHLLSYGLWPRLEWLRLSVLTLPREQ